MIEWFMGLPMWLQFAILFGVLDVLCALYLVYLCITAPREEEVFGRRDVDI